MDSDILLFTGIVMLILGLSTVVLGVEVPNPVSDEAEQKYDIDGSFAVAGTTDGAQIQDSSLNYVTPKSGLSLSFVGPNSNLAFGGADNVDVNIELRNESTGQVVDRYRENIGDIDTTGQKTVDFKFNRKKPGSYVMDASLAFECTALTYQCDNTDNFSTTLEVPN